MIIGDDVKYAHVSTAIPTVNMWCADTAKETTGRPRRRWEDNIKLDLQEVGGGRGDWMELAQDRDRWQALVGTVRDFRFR